MERIAKVGQRLGYGKGATVYRHPDREDRVVKVFRRRPDLFPREAGMLYQLPDHPGIGNCLGTVICCDRGEESPALVFHRYYGLRPLRFCQPVAALKLVGSIAWILIAVHNVGIVHCDIRPENFMLTKDVIPVLIDFGLAKRIGTSDRFPEGTRGFMAPEVLAGINIDQRTDIFSLGAVLHELITFANPLELQDLDVSSLDTEMGFQHFYASVARMDEPIRSLTARMTEYYQRDRFPNATEVYLAILKAICVIKKRQMALKSIPSSPAASS